uniref:ILEI/PANDER domain-containing protein n=1 Tax=Zonotrichia albicollis TaxID=44394 RepID=A0A8D2M4J0_ZONAL
MLQPPLGVGNHREPLLGALRGDTAPSTARVNNTASPGRGPTAGLGRRKSSSLLPSQPCYSPSCPQNHFAFKIISGAANVVGPSICFEDLVLMSSVKNNIGRGLNIALVNGESEGTDPLLPTARLGQLGMLLPPTERGKEGTPSWQHSDTSFPSVRMNARVRAYFTELGSSHVGTLGFRDNWVFLGAKGLMNKSPFEKHIKNDRETNKYEGWPELLEMEGCAPRKMD